MTAAKGKSSETIEVADVQIGQIEVGIVGLNPLLHNRMSEKAKRTLLLGGGQRKTAADRAAALKHIPVDEFRSSVTIIDDDCAPTYLAIMGSAFKGAMMTAALDVPSTKKAQIGRLVWIEEHYAPIWGDVKLHMSVVRSSDINRTPDIRSRAISPRWASIITISFVRPTLTETGVINLLSAAGRTAGVGDWRPEKGKGTYGQFRVANTDDPDLLDIQQVGREQQILALKTAEPYDRETRELADWFESERKARGR